MTLERWQRVKSLFEQALDQPPAACDAFLEESGESPSVVAEVRELISGDAQAGSFLGNAVSEESSTAALPAPGNLVRGQFRDSMPDESRPTRTILGAGSAGSSSESIEEGRFPAGTILAGRYRILGLLGRGGMGEVYRALDLILNQPVALKFLLNAAQSGKAALARFRNEVRIARQVSHPNV